MTLFVAGGFSVAGALALSSATLVLVVVHDFADWRSFDGVEDLDEIETLLVSHLLCFVEGLHAVLGAVGADQSHRAGTYVLVDAEFSRRQCIVGRFAGAAGTRVEQTA
jgi:hypothetical protein